MPHLDHDVDGLIRISEHRDAGITRGAFGPTLEDAGFAVSLHRRDDFLRHLLKVGDLVKADNVPDLHHSLLTSAHIPEQIRDGRGAGQECGVG